jgi:hypothetical protein
LLVNFPDDKGIIARRLDYEGPRAGEDPHSVVYHSRLTVYGSCVVRRPQKGFTHHSIQKEIDSGGGKLWLLVDDDNNRTRTTNS